MAQDQKIIIKKYANRRLYNTSSSSYIVLEDLSDFVKKGIDFQVIGVNGEDLTRATLTQIILEHEMQGYNMLPMDFLKTIIKLYDHKLSQSFTEYLHHTMSLFNTGQNSVTNIMQAYSEAYNKGISNFKDAGEQFAKFSEIFFNPIKDNDNKPKK
jgi:polyhydroxyalkanoate synthesis repressor PhaR